MKNIYFFQVGFGFDDSVYLPYAVGTMIAYYKKYACANSGYEFKDIFFKREKISTVIDKIENPYMVLFSCSVWNMEYNLRLAEIIKEKYSDCLIAFGGHSVSEDGSLLNTKSFIDLLMFGEGEITFYNLLKNIENNCIEKTENIALRKGNDIIKTPRKSYNDLSSFPSPYTEGVFSKIMEDNPTINFLAVLETNRGCPYNCAYCDWCAGRNVRHFSLEKVFSEIEWLGKNKIEYVFCADSNFGMFEKDIKIAEKLVETKRKYGYPQVFRPCYEKNSDERVYRICCLLNTEKMDKGATFAYQTLCKEALNNIGRKNLTLEHFSSLMKKYVSAGIPTYSELILGLPGETKESFCRGICKLFENGQHNSVSVYHCEVLPNSDFSRKEFLEKHKIEVIKISFNHIHSAPKKTEEVKEYSYIVRSTATLSRDDWVYANLFSVCVQLFHSLGILRHIAIYLHTQEIVDYYSFYTDLLKYILNSDSDLGRLFLSFENKYNNSLSGDWNYYNNDFGNVTWFFEEGAFLEFMTNFDSYLKDLTPFLESYFEDKDVFTDLLKYNLFLIRKPFLNEQESAFDYDFPEYFYNVSQNSCSTLKKNKIVVKVSAKSSFKDIASYAKQVVWFGRRRGMTLYNNDEEIVIERDKT